MVTCSPAIIRQRAIMFVYLIVEWYATLAQINAVRSSLLARLRNRLHGYISNSQNVIFRSIFPDAAPPFCLNRFG